MINLSNKQKIQEDEYIIPYHFLDLSLDQYKYLWQIEYLNLLKYINTQIKAFDEQNVLDIGCGDGRLCYELKKNKIKVAGVDFSEKAIKFAKIFNPDTDFFVQNIFNLNLDNKYSQITMLEVLEHFPIEKIQQSISNLSKVLKDDGVLFLSVPSINTSLGDKHYQHFSEKSLNNILAEHFKKIIIIGFTEINLYYYMYRCFLVIGYFIYPLRKKLNFIIKYYLFVNNFYKNRVMIGSPKKSRQLIAVCYK
jgi:2-polyprenyl-3-methyl-5-hydroxy-6-metoxy-1,4-benzoquinol methylase